MNTPFIRIALAAVISLASASAFAQTSGAYQVGLNIAQKRGYANADCYARVFAKHAVVTEGVNGKRGWFAASTPAYNADQRKTCGIDRLGDIAARQKHQAAGGARGGGAYSAGLGLAARSGHTGANAACFARVYSTYASQYPSAGGPGTWAIDGRAYERFRLEISSTCGLSR